jgi:superfamily II DNA/RNA helicase
MYSISNDLKNYSKYLKGTKVVAVYGGEDIRTQLKQLGTPPQIIVATPGRLIALRNAEKSIFKIFIIWYSTNLMKC